MKRNLCTRTFCLLLSSPINHLRAPYIYPEVAWSRPTLKLEITGLNHLTVNKVAKSSYVLTSYNSTMLLTHSDISMNNLSCNI